MDRKEAEKKKIKVYWWNFGKKTLDFEGSYKDYLKKIGVKVRTITHPFQKDVKGWRFKVSMSSTSIVIDSYDEYMRGCDDIIKAYSLMMGDKTLVITPRHRYNIN